ncbi:TPA: DUF3784 domain-containing protein [Clostridium perfringens]
MEWGIIISVLIIALFVVLGISFYMGKGLWLIAGYNIMSKEEREKYDMRAVGKFMGKIAFVIAFSISFWLIGEILSLKILFHLGTIVFWATIIFTLIYLNTNKRFVK